MEGFSYRYLMSDTPAIAGTVECLSDKTVFFAYGLIPQKAYDVYIITDEGMFCVQKDQMTGAEGTLSCTLSKKTDAPEGLFCIARSDRGTVALYESGVDVQRVTYDLWQQKNRKKTAKPTPDTVDEKVPEVQATESALGTKNALELENNTLQTVVYNAHASDECIDALPALRWDGRAGDVAPYFHAYPVVSLALETGAFWRFVRAPLAENPYAEACFLGRHCHAGRVDAIAYVIDGKDRRTQNGIPGFRFKKTGSGSGVWVYMEEV